MDTTRLQGWGLTTAEIMYYMPDHRSILQTFIWQDFDQAPRFPKLRKFLTFWSQNLDGPLAMVMVGHNKMIGVVELRTFGDEWRIH
jgi:uncharacterized protein Usg